LSTKQSETTKKEIFFPSIIGDWTCYTPEETIPPISITKSIGKSKKTIPEITHNQLLFFHQEFFEIFLEKLIEKINFHIDIESISIETLDHETFKNRLTDDIYQCKFTIPELEQIDLILSKETAKNICHRLCGGISQTNDTKNLTNLEINITKIINNIFISTLSNQWSTIFPFIPDAFKTHFGHYLITPQQSEKETIVIINHNIKLFNQSNLTISLLYSLETIEKLIFFQDMLNNNIKENISLKTATLSKTTIPLKGIVGTTQLTINEIKELEIGDVILIDNRKVDSPIKLVIDNQLQFNGFPIKSKENKLAIQILNYPHYETYINNQKKPDTGPFISSSIIDNASTHYTTKKMDTNNEYNITPPEDTHNIIDNDTDDIDDDADNINNDTHDINDDTDDINDDTDDMDDDTDDMDDDTDDMDDDNDDMDDDTDDMDDDTDDMDDDNDKKDDTDKKDDDTEFNDNFSWDNINDT
jgi:flagellar motor switch protein FliM